MSEPVYRMRYRRGVVGETRRVVHIARPVNGVIRTLCGETIDPDYMELATGGMPCMQCSAVASLGIGPPAITADMDTSLRCGVISQGHPSGEPPDDGDTTSY